MRDQDKEIRMETENATNFIHRHREAKHSTMTGRRMTCHCPLGTYANQPIIIPHQYLKEITIGILMFHHLPVARLKNSGKAHV